MEALQGQQIIQLQHTKTGKCLCYDPRTNNVGLADCALLPSDKPPTTLFVTELEGHSTIAGRLRPLQRLDRHLVPSATTSEVLVVPLDDDTHPSTLQGRSLVAADGRVLTTSLSTLVESRGGWRISQPFVQRPASLATQC